MEAANETTGVHHDPNQEAFNVAAQVTGAAPVDTKAELSKTRAAAGAAGGRAGAAKLTPEERAARARAASVKRWNAKTAKPSSKT